MINRQFFFDSVRPLFDPVKGKLASSQVDGLTALLDRWEADFWHNDVRWLAYPLATTFHETDKKMQPIREYGTKDYFIHRYWANVKLREQLGNTQESDAYLRNGRGFVQVTGMANDIKATKEIRMQYPALVAAFEKRTGQAFDLVANPEQALDTDIAASILFLGMMQGWFTGKKLADYFGGTADKPVQARYVINGQDKAQIIADHYRKFYAAISFTN